MLLICWAMATSFLAAYYWLQYTDFMNRVGGVPVYLNVGIDYGNNSARVWYNDTKALTGMTLFKVTRSLIIVAYDSAAGYGVYVTSLNGVASNSTHGWVWWKWDAGLLNWTLVQIGPDAYAVADKETFLWFYESGWPPPPPL
jgi:hypothetical protein